mgnify:CR=1 FL=1
MKRKIMVIGMAGSALKSVTDKLESDGNEVKVVDDLDNVPEILKGKYYEETRTVLASESIEIKTVLTSEFIFLTNKEFKIKILFTILFDSNMVFINRTLNNIIRKAICMKNIELSKQYINNVIKFDCIN